MKKLELVVWVMLFSSFTLVVTRPKAVELKVKTIGITEFKTSKVCAAPFGRYEGKISVVGIPFRRF